MGQLVKFPLESLTSLAWVIISKDLRLPPDEVRLSQREVSVLIEFLRSAESPFIFDESVTGSV